MQKQCTRQRSCLPSTHEMHSQTIGTEKNPWLADIMELPDPEMIIHWQGRAHSCPECAGRTGPINSGAPKFSHRPVYCSWALGHAWRWTAIASTWVEASIVRRPLLHRKRDRRIYRKSHSRRYSLQESCRWRRATHRVGDSLSPLGKTKSISSRLHSAAVPLTMQIQFMCFRNLVDDVRAARWFSIVDCFVVQNSFFLLCKFRLCAVQI